MSLELFLWTGLWAVTFLFPDFISQLVEPLSIILVVLSGIGWGMQRLFQTIQENDDNYSAVISEEKFSFKRYIISALQWLGNYFWLLLAVIVVRAFVFDVARVVSGSLKPTVLINDTILVNKYRYGLRLPLTGTLLVSNKTPQRGDIVSFRAPHNRSVTMLKRMIGVPGDHVQYQNKKLTINGSVISQRVLGVVHDQENKGQIRVLLQSTENLDGKEHDIYTTLDEPGQINTGGFLTAQSSKNFSLTVPENQYFVMGDNRDNSSDSRYWGCISNKQLLGEVSYVIFSWDKMASWSKPWTWVRWERLGMRLL